MSSSTTVLQRARAAGHAWWVELGLSSPRALITHSHPVGMVVERWARALEAAGLPVDRNASVRQVLVLVDDLRQQLRRRLANHDDVGEEAIHSVLATAPQY